MPAILENWFTLTSITDAKLGNCKLVGNVYGREGTKDGIPITTSDVVLVGFDGENKSIVYTQSGSAYVLGVPDKGFADTLRNLGMLYNPACPLEFLYD